MAQSRSRSTPSARSRGFDQCDERYANHGVCYVVGHKLSVWHRERSGRSIVVYGAERQQDRSHSGDRDERCGYLRDHCSDRGQLPNRHYGRIGQCFVFYGAKRKSNWAYTDERDQHFGHHGVTLPPSAPFAMNTAADGTIWFTETGGAASSVAHMPIGATMASQITSIALPTALSAPLGIAPGAAGTMIVSELTGHKIAAYRWEQPAARKYRNSVRERRIRNRWSLAQTERFGSPRPTPTSRTNRDRRHATRIYGTDDWSDA